MGKSTFEKNGGYFIDGVNMDCKVTGEPVANVSEEPVSVIGSRAVMNMVGMPKKNQKKVSKFWHFMNEFVDKDGNVFHKGVEQPELKGTLPPTKVEPKKKAKRRTKNRFYWIDRRRRKQCKKCGSETKRFSKPQIRRLDG